jgi:hypothetical protein
LRPQCVKLRCSPRTRATMTTIWLRRNAPSGTNVNRCAAADGFVRAVSGSAASSEVRVPQGQTGHEKIAARWDNRISDDVAAWAPAELHVRLQVERFAHPASTIGALCLG